MGNKYSGYRKSNFLENVVSLKFLPRNIVLLIDLTICFLSLVTALYINEHFYKAGFDANIINTPQKIILLLISQAITFWAFHTYSGILRYSSFVDITKILGASVLNLVVLMIVNLISYANTESMVFQPNVLIVYTVFSFLLLFLIRLGVKTVYDLGTLTSSNIIPVMIYGTKSAAIGIAKMLMSEQIGTRYKLVGFIDDDKNAIEKMIMGVRVYHLNDEMIENVIARKAKAIIVSPMKLNQTNSNIELEKFIDHNLSVLSLPPIDNIRNNIPQIGPIKSIQIEDLLERPEIKISTENISSQLKDKVVLVTGAAGSIGREIAVQVLKFEPKLVVLLDQAESPMHELKLELEKKYEDRNIAVFLGDVRNKDRMDFMMDLYHPDIIYHAAAYKHVPMMEDNPVESILTNVQGTKILADLSIKYRVQRFVMVSTDKAVNPTNVMGASKRIAEIYVQSLYKKYHATLNGSTTKFITTRFGNVLGSSGSVIPHFKSQIENGGPVTVTHPEIIRYFMTIPEACMLVLEAGSMGNGGEIYIFDMGKPVKIVDLARKMIRLAGYVPEKDIEIVFTGLRPGEKLYEELLNKKEITQKTHHPKIMIANVQQFEFDKISVLIDKMINYSKLCKDFLTVATMKKVVPEFKSKNSQYERLDL